MTLKVYESSTPPITDIRVMNDVNGDIIVEYRRGDGPWQIKEHIRTSDVKEKWYAEYKRSYQYTPKEWREEYETSPTTALDHYEIERQKATRYEVERRMHEIQQREMSRVFYGYDPASDSVDSIAMAMKPYTKAKL